MSGILSSIWSIIDSDVAGDDDTSDKLSRRYSVIILVAFCLVVSTKEYVGDPINCWVPDNFTIWMRDYANDICWVKDTYHMPLDSTVSDTGIRTELINYYQWVPMVLIVQALLFYLPYMAWKGLNHNTGCDLTSIVKILNDTTIVNPDVRRRATEFVGQHLDRFLCTREKAKQPAYFSLGKKYGNYMTTVYFSIKLLYLANAVCQLYLLNLFVGDGYRIYGVEVVRDLLTGKLVRVSAPFPKSISCSFTVKNFGEIAHNHTVQCVLPINCFNEKIYLFLWLWLAFIFLCTFVSILSSIWNITQAERVRFLEASIKMKPGYNYQSEHDNSCIHAFATQYLKQDGVLTLRLLGKNVNEVILCDILMELYTTFKTYHYPLIPQKDISSSLVLAPSKQTGRKKKRN